MAILPEKNASDDEEFGGMEGLQAHTVLQLQRPHRLPYCCFVEVPLPIPSQRRRKIHVGFLGLCRRVCQGFHLQAIALQFSLACFGAFIFECNTQQP